VQLVLAMGLVENSGHWSQTALPVTAVNVLAAHCSGVVVAMGQKSPAGQARQSLELPLPVSGLYVPAEQLVGLTEATGQ
jgi:hypothetical protein